MNDLNELETLIIGWAKARKIIPNATPESQVLKAVSEMGELADATAKCQEREMRDAIGDVVVCLVNLCALKGWTLRYCLNEAWLQIKDREGHAASQWLLREGGSEVSASDFTTMTDSELERFLYERDLVACGTGDCLHRRCIWCGSEAAEMLAKMEEEANETL